ncbi:unnamed protein product [Sphagnum tenellum]
MVSLMPPSLDRLHRSLVCCIAAATWRNDILVETWSIASSYRIVPLMVTSSSSTFATSLTNNFSARVFYLALAATFLVIAAAAPPLSSLSSSKSTSTLLGRKNRSAMMVSTMGANTWNVSESNSKSTYRCNVLAWFALPSKCVRFSSLDNALYSAHRSTCCDSW